MNNEPLKRPSMVDTPTDLVNKYYAFIANSLRSEFLRKGINSKNYPYLDNWIHEESYKAAMIIERVVTNNQKWCCYLESLFKQSHSNLEMKIAALDKKINEKPSIKDIRAWKEWFGTPQGACISLLTFIGLLNLI